MKITVLMVITYITDCILIRTKPCKYFQLNSPYFNGKEGIFSKIETDRLIPERWRLPQRYDDDRYFPEQYPVFVKPEWGQNARGIFRADDSVSLTRIRQIVSLAPTRYLIQQGATEQREFEIFSIQHHADIDAFAELTVTEVINDTESNPINSIYNCDTGYREITDQFSSQQKQTLWKQVCQIGRFGISRVSIRADSIDNMLAGKFHVIEVNLFAPMPINMLDPEYRFADLWRMIRRYMLSLARITKYRDKRLKEKPVFTKIMLYNRKSRLLNYIRKKI
jgi:hypothetical protein